MAELVDHGLRSLGVMAKTPRATLHLCRELTSHPDTLLPCADPWRAVKVMKRELVRDPRRVVRERDAMRRLINTEGSAPVASAFIANILRTAKDNMCLYFILEVCVLPVVSSFPRHSVRSTAGHRRSAASAYPRGEWRPTPGRARDAVRR